MLLGLRRVRGYYGAEPIALLERRAIRDSIADDPGGLVLSNDSASGETPTRLNFIDLFAGCGGLSLGLMNAGWTGLFAVEKDPRAFQTLKANLLQRDDGFCFDWPDWMRPEPFDISDFNSFYWRHLKGLQGQVDLVAGGPPCQGFSFAGRRDKTDRRNRLFERFLAVVRMVRPKYLLLENVSGIDIAHGTKARRINGGVGRPPKPFSHRIKDRLYAKLGYSVFGEEIRADECGVAQWRPRFFMVGIRHDLLENSLDLDPFEVIEDLRAEFLARKGLELDDEVTVGMAISDLETAGRQKIDYPHAPRGFKQIRYEGPQTDYQRFLHGGMNGCSPNSLRLANHRDSTIERFTKIIETCRPGVSLSKEDKERLGGIKKHTLVLLDRDSASHTLTTLPDDYIHYSEPRILTVREMARLQSFPDWWEFHGKYTTGGPMRTSEAPRYTQVGNAVAPFVAELIGMAVEEIDARLDSRR